MDDGEAMAAIAIAPAVRKDGGGRRRAAELTGCLWPGEGSGSEATH